MIQREMIIDPLDGRRAFPVLIGDPFDGVGPATSVAAGDGLADEAVHGGGRLADVAGCGAWVGDDSGDSGDGSGDLGDGAYGCDCRASDFVAGPLSQS